METPQNKVEIIEKYFSDFTPRQWDQWKGLDGLYREWNEKINVISRKDMDGLYEKHVLHSLAIATQFSFTGGMNIVDIGTGGGFPGIPLAIFYPEAVFHLVDSIGKKIKVVEGVAEALGINNIKTYHTRAETLTPLYFDFAISRAVAPLKDLWNWARPLLKNQQHPGTTHKNGLICLKGGDLTEEIAQSGLRPHVWEIASLFDEPWFTEKFIVYVPRSLGKSSFSGHGPAKLYHNGVLQFARKKPSFVPMVSISVCIVEDNQDIRHALEQILSLSPGFELAGSFASGEEALVGIPLAKPQVVMMDIHLGGIDGIECVRILKARCPEILFMMCTVYDDDVKIFEALRAGASGYVLKQTTPDRLLDAVRELFHGGSPMSSQIARKVVAAFQGKQAEQAERPGGAEMLEDNERLDSLSKREFEILQMLAKGMIYKEISLSLYISPETVRKHVYHIYEKLHVGNRVEAINKFFGR